MQLLYLFAFVGVMAGHTEEVRISFCKQLSSFQVETAELKSFKIRLFPRPSRVQPQRPKAQSCLEELVRYAHQNSSLYLKSTP